MSMKLETFWSRLIKKFVELVNKHLINKLSTICFVLYILHNVASISVAGRTPYPVHSITTRFANQNERARKSVPSGATAPGRKMENA